MSKKKPEEENVNLGTATEAKPEASGYYSQNATLKQDVLKEYMNRDPFNYDFNSDALYQQYKDKYVQQGKMAMQDTMGQAAAMTGGYGNSWAQSVGQQAYAAQLQNLNDVVPELYQMALDNYNREGEEMLNKYALYSAEEQKDYERYLTEREWNRLYGESEETEESPYPNWYQEGGEFSTGATVNKTDINNLDEFLKLQGYTGSTPKEYVDFVTTLTGEQSYEKALDVALQMMTNAANYGSVDLSDTNILNQIKGLDSPLARLRTINNLVKSGAINQATADYYRTAFGSSSKYSSLYEELEDKATTFTDDDALASWAYGLADEGIISEDEAYNLIQNNLTNKE